MASLKLNKENTFKEKKLFGDEKPLVFVQKRRPLRARENVNVNNKIVSRFQPKKEEKLIEKPETQILNKDNAKIQIKKIHKNLQVPHITHNGKLMKPTTLLHLSQRKYKLSAKKLNAKKLKQVKDQSRVIQSNIPKKSQSSSSNYLTISSEDQEENYTDALSNISKKSELIADINKVKSKLYSVNSKESNQSVLNDILCDNVRALNKKSTNILKGKSIVSGKINVITGPKINDEPVKAVTAISPIQGFSSLSLKDILYDVDSLDLKDEFCMALYAKDIHEYLYNLEKLNDLKENYIASASINVNMRLILVDWIMQIHQHFKLLPETLYLTINLIDRYLQKVKDLPRKNLQLLGISAMFIACKYEELYIMEAKDFVYVAKDTYSIQEILNMEIDILKCIDFNFSYPYPIHFLRRFTKISQVSYEEHTLSKFLIELTLLDSCLLGHYPSKIAAAALCLSMKVFDYVESISGSLDEADCLLKDKNDLYMKIHWNNTLKYHSKYDENDLNSLMSYYIKTFQKTLNSSHYKTVFAKYSSSKLGNVAMIFKEFCLTTT